MANLKRPSKKTAIIAGIIIVLLAAIATTGTVVFLKDRGSTEAADLENSQVLSQTDETSTGVQNQDNAQDATTQTDNQLVTAGQNQNDQTTGATANDDATGNAGGRTTAETTIGTTGTAATGATATTTDNIQETTITRTEQVEVPERQIAEGHYVGWTPMQVNAQLSSAENIDDTTPDEIVTNKTGDKTVEQGENVTYVITVQNKTHKDLKAIEVKDALDAEILDVSTVKYLEDSEEATLTENVLVWNLDMKSDETITIKFEVTVKTNVVAGTKLINSVITNGKEIKDDEKPETEIEQAKIEVEATKVWNDDNNKAKVRPESVELVLVADGKETENKLTANAENNWKVEFKDLNKYAEDGKEIEYTVKESKVTNYKEPVYSADGLTVTNIIDYTSVMTSKEATKVWNDDNNKAGVRPESVELVLVVDGKETENKLTANAENKWTVKFENLNKYTADGKEIEYTVKESKATNYKEPTYSEDGLTVTNTIDYTSIMTSKEATKVWNDDNNKAGVRPESVELVLVADGKETENKLTANAENKWTVKFENLNKYAEDGKEIEYTVKESKATNYKEPTYSEDGLTVTNTIDYTSIMTSKEATKVWADDNNKAGVRPESVELVLVADGKETENKLIANAENKWTVKFENLNKYTAEGKEIKYTVKESKATNYKEPTYSEDGLTVTNTIDYTSIMTLKEATKVWKDDNNIAKVRPESVELVLVADGKETENKLIANAENKWTVKFENLNKYTAEGKEIKYTVKESKSEYYKEPTYSEDGLTVTNEIDYTTIKTSLSGTKTWDDANNQDGKRPVNITVILYKGEDTNKTEVSRTSCIPDENGIWKYSFTEIQKFENGKEIKYSVDEVAVAGYEKEINGNNIKNTHIPETTKIEGTKTWNDANDQDGARPTSINVVLSKKVGETTTRVTVKEVKADKNGEWKYSFENLPAYENGKKITYAISEEDVAGYTSTMEGNNIINTHTPEKTSVSVTKVWSDSENKVNVRPESVEVELYENGAATGNKVTLNKDNNWQYTFTDLDKYKNKNQIEYKVKELNSDGRAIENNNAYNDIYTTTYSQNDNGLIITNTIDSNVLKPHITTTKESSILSCAKGITEGTLVHEGDVIRYVITIKNDGKVPAKVEFTDTIDDGLKVNNVVATLTNSTAKVPNINKNGNDLSLSDYQLADGETLTITIDAEVKTLPEGEYNGTISENVATIVGKVGDEKEEEKPSDETEYNVIKPNVEVRKTSSIVECNQSQTEGTTVHEGDKIEYTITIENNGTDSDIIKSINDTIKSGLTYVRDSLNVTVNGNNTTTDTAAELPEVAMSANNRSVVLNKDYVLESGRKITIKFTVSVDKLADGEYSKNIDANVVAVNNNNKEDDKGDYEVKKAHIESSKSVNKDKAEYNDELTYTITAKNLSDVSANVTINDQIPEGTQFIPGSIKVNGEQIADDGHYVNGKITYVGNLANKNDNLILTFDVKVTETTIGKTIENKASINEQEKTADTKVIKKVSVKATQNKPINLVLVLDVSGSMEGSRIQNLISSAKSLASTALKDEDSTSTVTLITYSSDATNVGTYNYSTKANLIRAIDGLRANGGTNIYAGLNAAISAVNSITNGGETRVVFLTDGSPTIPSDEYVKDIGMENNTGSGFDNNTKTKIVEKAQELKGISSVSKVYAIGVGVNSLSNTTLGYVEEVSGYSINKDITFDKENHTFTITVTNPVDEDITLETISASFSNIEGISELSNEGTISSNYWGYVATWNDIEIEANGTVELTGSYTASKDWWSGREETPRGSVSTTPNQITANVEEEQFNGSNLFTVTKTKNGVQYRGIITRTYAQYILSKISSNGEVMNVANASEALSDVEKDLEPEVTTYVLDKEGETVVVIPESRQITSKVTVKIGDETKKYTLEQLSTESGVDGLKYLGDKFEWTVTSEKVLKNKLSLEYKVMAE